MLARDKHPSTLDLFINDEESNYVRAFVPGNPFQSCPTFTSKAGTYLCREPERCSSGVGSRP
jgi:hypothetical protein